jgi:digeranylgeranylglycerophospholipid reductase
METGKMKYDLIVIGAGPAGLMAARTAARDGLKVVLMEQRKKLCPVRRFCSQLIRIGDSGFSSDKKPTDRELRPVTVTFEINYGRHTLRLNNLEDDVTVDYRGPLRSYYNEIFISPSGYSFNRLESNEQFYGFQIDKGELLAGMLDECTRAGGEVRWGTKCIDVEDHSGGVSVRLSGQGEEETLTARRLILADGAFSSLIDTLGFNKERTDLGPTIKFLSYILDRVDSPFPESRHLQMCVPSLFPGQVPLALWAHDTFQMCMATPVFSKIKLSDVLDRFMKESPFASWFASSKVVDRLGCTMALRKPIWEQAKGERYLLR